MNHFSGGMVGDVSSKELFNGDIVYLEIYYCNNPVESRNLMRIVNVIGGLGNQMFQCAFAIALKNAFDNDEVYIDTHHYKNPYPKTFRGNNFYHNGYEVSKLFPTFNIPIATPSQILKCSYYIPNYFISRIARKFLPVRKTEYLQSYKDAYIFNEEPFLLQNINYYEGYWLSPKFFNGCKEKVLEAFEFMPFTTKKNEEIANKLSRDNSVTIHIRRGDYLNGDNVTGICTLDYYKDAISRVREIVDNPVFFIFSNDQEWCIKNLKEQFGQSPVHFVTNNKGSESYRDMQLMSLARCNILANSSFSWWGAYLNKRNDQIVYAPKKWVNNQDDRDACVDNWIKI